ncbi:replicative DNA helicase [Curvibacter sp. HBC61]|uniref:DNA 5'-3' helicase n=1 Tax=Curvibacter cyanobacteriorum TaxID=3026422 RepID=A0ABT5MVL6_9BURK|nr:replicative DNA helicase [Curvibacter sp. HBC61]MDD0837887.1 replicative DNA helicase [Curvibacter sp. HBC61]
MSSTFPDLPDELAVPVDMVHREAEQSILGALMRNAQVYDVIGDILQPAYFFVEDDRTIYTALSGLINACKPCDPISTHEALAGSISLEYLVSLEHSATGGLSSARRHAEIVASRAKGRELAAIASEVQELARNHAMSIDERVELVTEQLSRLAGDAQQDDWVGSDQGMVEFCESIQSRNDGGSPDFVSTGLRDLDERLNGGLRPGNLVVIAARPGIGKTALALDIGMHSARQGESVGMFSLEMPRAELQNRQVSKVSKIPFSSILRPERLSDWQWSEISRTAEQIRQIPFFINDNSSLNINQLRAKSRSLKRRKGLRVLIVDYLGLMDGTDVKANRTTQLEEVTRGLKKLAKELGITVLLLAQLNREVEKRTDQVPQLSDLRDCGAIEQDADIVLFPLRPGYSNPSLGSEWKNYARIFVAKQRGGSTGFLDLFYTGETMTFGNWDGDRPTTGRQRSADL